MTRPRVSRTTPHRVAVLALEGIVLFDLSIPCEVFGHVRDRSGLCYAVALCTAAPRTRGRVRRKATRVRTAMGSMLEVPHGLEALDDADTVVVPGIVDVEAPFAPSALRALHAVHARGGRIVSICTGAFVLAAAGLLDGRRATTHWRDAGLLATRHPDVTIDPGVLYVDDGDVFTSAGMASGIDLCLHIVRRDHGAAVANAAARRLVVAPHRSGGQAQFAEHPVPDEDGSGLEETRNWVLARLERRVSVGDMAAHARMSRRTFMRRFRAEAGVPPLHWLLHQRVLRARQLLESTQESVDRIAHQCGFGSALSFRQHFRRATHSTPLAHRRAFQGEPRPGRPTNVSRTT